MASAVRKIVPEIAMGKQLVVLLALVTATWIGTTAVAQSSRDLRWLTETERQWLAEHPKLRVAPTPDYPPFEFWNQENRFQGIVDNYLKYFENELGIKFDLVQTKNWEQNLAHLRSRKIDAVSLIVPWTDRDFVTVSDPYISYPALIIVNKEETRNLTLQDLEREKKRVAVPNDYTGESFLRTSYPEIEIVEADGPAHGIRMLTSGDVDAFFGGASVVSFLAEREGISNLRIAGKTDFNYSNGFGVRSDWPIFAEIISKTLKRLTPADHRAFHAQWVTTDFFQKRFYEYNRFWWILGGILVDDVVRIPGGHLLESKTSGAYRTVGGCQNKIGPCP